MLYGCRKVRVFENVTEAVIDLHGSFGFIEVTNTNPIPVPPAPEPEPTPDPTPEPTPTPEPDPEEPVEGASIQPFNTTGDGFIYITVNDFPEQGHKGTTIPIPPGTTRKLPLVVYKFKATGAVTVVAYGL